MDADEIRSEIRYRSRNGKRVRMDGDTLAYYNPIHFLNRGERTRDATGDAIAVSNDSEGEFRWKGILDALPSGANVGDLIAWDGSKWVAGSSIANALPNGGSVGDLLYWNGVTWAAAIYGLDFSDNGKILEYSHPTGWLPVSPFSIGGTPSNFDMVYWNGSNWQTLPIGAGPSTDNYVLTYQHGGASLQLRPVPTQIADGTSANSILKWNGSAWVEVVLSPGAGEDGYALTWDNSAGTYALQAPDGMPAASGAGQLAFYNGSSWTVNGAPSAGSMLWWDGSTWQPLSGTPNTGAMLTYHAGAWKYANNSGSVPTGSFLSWTGSDWTPVSGLSADQFIYPTTGGGWGSAPLLGDGQVYQKNGALGFKSSNLSAANSLVYYDGSSTKTLQTISDTATYEGFLYWHPNTAEYKYSQSPRDGSNTGLAQAYFYNNHGTPTLNHWYMTDVANSPGDFFHRGNGDTMASSDMPALTGADFITWHAGDHKWKATSGMGTLTAGSFAYRSSVHTGGWNGAQPPGPYYTAYWNGVSWLWKPLWYGSITYTALYGEAQSVQAIVAGQMYYWNGVGTVITTPAPVTGGWWYWNGSTHVNMPTPAWGNMPQYTASGGWIYTPQPLPERDAMWYSPLAGYTTEAKPVYQSAATYDPLVLITAPAGLSNVIMLNGHFKSFTVTPVRERNSRSGATYSDNQGAIDVTNNPFTDYDLAYSVSVSVVLHAVNTTSYDRWSVLVYLEGNNMFSSKTLNLYWVTSGTITNSSQVITLAGEIYMEPPLVQNVLVPHAISVGVVPDDGTTSHDIRVGSVTVRAKAGTGQ
jgi:hypothetical protein